MEILKQGAEARLYLGEYQGRKCLIKERFAKKYRHQDVDIQITRQRMKAEAKAANRCLAAGVHAPKILHTDLNERKIYMEYFEEAITAKEFIHQKALEGKNTIEEDLRPLCELIGINIAKMHANNIIHGDLTTSNILIDLKARPDQSENVLDVIFVDFGLSHYNQGVEDKGVDLYVLERALQSTHSEQTFLFDFILNAYRNEYGKDQNVIIAKFEEVRARGRKRTMIG